MDELKAKVSAAAAAAAESIGVTHCIVLAFIKGEDGKYYVVDGGKSPVPPSVVFAGLAQANPIVED